MNVVVDGAHVVGLALQHRLQRGDDFFRAAFRRAIRMPKAPRVKVHAGFSKERGSIKIVRKLLHQVTHGVAIAFRCLALVGVGIGRETQRHGRDVSLLAG